MDKLCTKCNESKDILLFVKSRVNKSGYRALCRQCDLAYRASRRITHHSQIREYELKNHRKRRLQYQYGVTEEYIEQLRISQDNSCAICKSEVTLVIDHCHDKGHVRGLLCSPCNLGLGHFRDDPERMSQAITYLKKKYK
jgi:hypothetical protein